MNVRTRKETVIIVNPVSGGFSPDKKSHLLREPAQILGVRDVLGLNGDTKTGSPTDFRNLVRQVESEYDNVIIASGDGGNVDALNASQNPTTNWGFLPFGRGNMLLYELYPCLYPASRYTKGFMAKFTPKRLLRSLAHLIKNATPRPIDMLEHCGRRGFATSMGLDGDIILGSEAAKKKRRKSGLWSYLRAGWDAFHSHDHYSAEITVGDETERLDNLITVGVTKLQFFGYGLRVCPNAVNDDGNLYVKVVRGEKYRNVLSAALSSLRTDGNKVGQDFSGKKVKVRTSRPVNLQMDGDYTETSDLFEFKVLPGAARVLY